MSIERIFRRYHQDLYRYCLAIVGNPEDAQDALQNTMVKAMRALEGEKRQIKLKPWLYRIAHNESIDLLRKRRPTESLEGELVAGAPSAAEAVETRERLRGLIADLGELPDRQRGALTMREMSGLSFEQIGAAFGTSSAVARQTVYEARLGLREMDEGRDMPCAEVCRALSDGDGRVARRRDIRAHLRGCPDCRAFRDGIADRRQNFASLAPLPAIAAAGILRGVLAAGASASSAGVAGAVGAGAGGTVATSAIVKSAATVAVVAAVGAGAADRSGLVDIPLPGSGKSSKTQSNSEPRSGSAGSPADAPGGSATIAAPGRSAATKRAGRSPAAGARSKGSKAKGRGHHGHPAASSHGQQTAAAHRASRGGRSAQHAPATPKPRSPPPPSQSNSDGGGPPPSAPPPAQVAPDKPGPPTSQSSDPVDSGATRGGGPR